MPKIRYSASSTKSKFRGGIFNKKALSFPVVSGGVLHSDGTYYYRKFLTTDNLVVTGSLVADILVIGGGGAGGTHGDAGGGGAGTVLYFPTQNLSSQTYLCNVAQASGNTAQYVWTKDGNPSQFGSLTAASGGGTGYANSYPSGAHNQTLNGGGYQAGGGGAGASAVGKTGGSGTNAYSTWATATSTGVDGYYAGGGSSSRSPSASSPGGLGGGGVGAPPTYYNNNNGGDAVANTGSGGGGGGSYFYNTGGSCASGLIIVRYTREQLGG